MTELMSLAPETGTDHADHTADRASRPWLDEDEQHENFEREIDVNEELEKLVGEYIERQRELQRQHEISGGRAVSDKVPAHVSTRVAAMFEVLHSDELKDGESLADIIGEKVKGLREQVKTIKDTHGPLRGARYVEPEWDAAADRPVGTGYLDPAEEYPSETANELNDLYEQETALLALGDVAAELHAMKDGEHPTWNRPGDIDGDARIGFVGKLGTRAY